MWVVPEYLSPFLNTSERMRPLLAIFPKELSRITDRRVTLDYRNKERRTVIDISVKNLCPPGECRTVTIGNTG